MQPAATIPVASPPVFYIPANAVSRKYDRYPPKTSIILGILQIIVGAICVILNICSLGILGHYSLGVISHGIWCGIMFIVTGAIGCSAGKTKSKCQVIGYMVLCIISASFALVLLIIGIFGVIHSQFPYCRRYTSDYRDYYFDEDCLRRFRQETAFQACLVVGGVIEGLLGIFGAVICCKAVCCCSTPQTGFVLATYSPNSGVLLQQPDTQGLQVPHHGVTTAFNSQQVPMASVYPAYPTGFNQYGMAQEGATAAYAYNTTEDTAVLLNEGIPQKDEVKHPIDPPPYSH